jgi:methionine-S-sulfoxide reductase
MEKNEIAVFGGGCFWCTEAVFQKLRGVKSTVPGYTGGHVPHPTSTQVYAGNTGHAEVTRFEYDSTKISYNDLLQVFFATHDPTTLNRQGYDVGDEYRSAIFYANDQQKREAEAFIKQLAADRVFKDPIVTTLEPLGEFYEAEDYHKDFYRRNRGQSYCQVIIDPKLKKLKEHFASLIEE